MTIPQGWLCVTERQKLQNIPLELISTKILFKIICDFRHSAGFYPENRFWFGQMFRWVFFRKGSVLYRRTWLRHFPGNTKAARTKAAFAKKDEGDM